MLCFSQGMFRLLKSLRAAIYFALGFEFATDGFVSSGLV